MKIKNLEITNFKFHRKLKFKIDKPNCLIYGENGTGKSSIYWALYSVFKVYFRNNEFNYEKFKNSSSDENLNIKIRLDSDTLSIPATNYDLPKSINSENFKTIYFINQDLLNEMIDGDNNDFYNRILLHLKKYFITLENFTNKYEQVNTLLTSSNFTEKSEEKNRIDNDFHCFLVRLEWIANDILNNSLQENFSIIFEFQNGELDTTKSDLQFDSPNITLKIDNETNLKLHFNEAKLKLTSIAIFFALIKLEEEKTNQIKLLVLDDFLTSLDMANRHYIIEYIFKNFKKYQKIILTHNLQFYNLILDWLKINSQFNQWDFKNIYSRLNEDNEESIIYDENTNYIEEAKEKLYEDELQTCGNLIRKEFERIIHELEKLYHIGKKEESNIIVDLIINDKPIYKNQNELLENIIPQIKHCQNMSQNIETNKERIKTSLNDICFEEIFDNSHLKSILKSLLFYRKILMNKASHDNPDAEIYRKEYENSIIVIEELNSILGDLTK